MRGPAVHPIVIAAGGTGGHLFPAEALAAELLARGERIALMTDARSAAFDSAAFANAERFVLRGSGLSGRGALRAAKGALALAAGAVQARSLGARVFADVVPEAVAALPAALRERLLVTQQCRPEDLNRVRLAYQA